MKPTLAILLLVSVPVLASDLPELARQIEHFPATRGQGTDAERLQRFFDLYWAARLCQLSDVAAVVGSSKVDECRPDFSAAHLALIHRLPHLELAALSSIDRAHLNAGEQLNDDLLRRRLDTEIEGERFGSVDPWQNDYILVDQMNDRITGAIALIEELPARNAPDFERMIALLRTYPHLVDEGIARLEEGRKRGITPPKVTLRHVPDHLADAIAADPQQSDLLEPFRRMPDTIPAAERERLRREAATVYAQQLVPAFRKLHDYLVSTYIPHARETTAASDLPDGKAWYAWLLRYYTTTDLTPEEIHRIGLAEVKRIRAEMDAIIPKTGFKGDFHEFCEWLRTDPRFFYDKPDDLVAGYRDIAKRIDPELIKLFGRLPRLPYGVKPMEPSMAKTAPSALYDPGTLVQGRPGWMLANTYDLKARPKWGMESLTAHEAVPGHHLQLSLAQELGALPEWRRWDNYPVFAEGWGLYAESLGDELGLYKDPYSKFGALNNEMWRAIRLVVDTGLHAQGWTRQQAINYCRENSAKTEVEIENEVDRYIVQPGSVPCYKIGEMKIRELRNYAAKTLGDKFDVRAFHDHILGQGQLPLDVLEKSVKEWVASVKAR